MSRVLVDTSVWIDHLATAQPELVALLIDVQVLGHPWVRGEIALGTLPNRDEVLGLLEDLPRAAAASDHEVAAMIERRLLFGRGLGYVDVHLLAATLLTEGARLWSRDRRLHQAAVGFGVAYEARA